MKQSSVFVSLFLFSAMVLGLFSFGLPHSAVQAAQASPTPQATDPQADCNASRTVQCERHSGDQCHTRPGIDPAWRAIERPDARNGGGGEFGRHSEGHESSAGARRCRQGYRDRPVCDRTDL